MSDIVPFFFNIISGWGIITRKVSTPGWNMFYYLLKESILFFSKSVCFFLKCISLIHQKFNEERTFAAMVNVVTLQTKSVPTRISWRMLWFLQLFIVFKIKVWMQVCRNRVWHNAVHTTFFVTAARITFALALTVAVNTMTPF